MFIVWLSHPIPIAFVSNGMRTGHKRPVFRDVEHTANGTRVSKTKALDYSKHRHHLIRLGRTSGFEKKLEFYDLRRASGKRLKGRFSALLILPLYRFF
jgi:hypothetical protein